MRGRIFLKLLPDSLQLLEAGFIERLVQALLSDIYRMRRQRHRRFLYLHSQSPILYSGLPVQWRRREELPSVSPLWQRGEGGVLWCLDFWNLDFIWSLEFVSLREIPRRGRAWSFRPRPEAGRAPIPQLHRGNGWGGCLKGGRGRDHWPRRQGRYRPNRRDPPGSLERSLLPKLEPII